jgi:SAM-dependent methyltransferase
VWEVLTAAIAELDGPLTIVDAGGGTGGFAVPLAALGHTVTVVDPSPDSLAALERRAAEEGTQLTAVQGDLDSLLDVVPAGGADLVLCHNVLEVVDDPTDGLRRVAAAMRVGGIASVLVANRIAAVLSRAIAGHFMDAAAVLDDPAGVWGDGDPAHRRFGLEQIAALLAGARLETTAIHGIRVFTDLVTGTVLDSDPGSFDALIDVERRVSSMRPFRDVATQLHLLAKRSR